MIRNRLIASAAAMAIALGAALPANARDIHVAPTGSDRGDGSASKPFRTLERAQAEVRRFNRKEDVTVILADGTYPLAAPLRFGPADGGHGDRNVTWRAAPGASPVLSGGQVVTGWTRVDADANIWAAAVPKGMDSRQLYYDDVPLDRAAVALAEADIAFDANGMTLKGDAAKLLEGVKADRMELHMLALWSSRNVPAHSITGNYVRFQQPAWYNSVSNNDTATKPHDPGANRFRLVGSCAFLKAKSWKGAADSWCIDPAEGRLYIRAGYRLDPSRARIVLPRLEALVSVSGTTAEPVRNLAFRGLRFSHTSWMGPSSPEGYADIQTGAFLTGNAVGTPEPFGSCFSGCRYFEAKREQWSLVPGAVQVSRARNIRFVDNQFSQLGQVALGIGNDGGANLSGVDLGAQSILVEGNRFVALAGGAIIAGGVRADAHHPSTDALRNADLVIRDNVITDVARDLRSNAAVFVSYFDGVRIERNDISDSPYTAIAVGWGWGHNDVGGTYGLAADRGRYSFQPRYASPTIMRNVQILRNRLINVNHDFLDGGGIYTLSAIPGTIVAENYLSHVGGNALYTDQGSKFIRFERNVIDTSQFWLHGNNGAPISRDTPTAMRDPRYGERWISPRTTDNAAIGNWHTSIKIRGDWIPALRNVVEGNVHVPDKAWPAAAQAVIDAAGPRPRDVASR